MESCKLPEEIITEILYRLPVKSLLRFRSVCKSWLFEISSPNFTRMHLHHSSSSIILSSRSDSGMYKFTSDLSRLHSVENASVNLEPPASFYKTGTIVNSCNGIVCLNGTDHYKRIYLWNPATKRYRLLPRPLYKRFDGYSVRVGFDSISNDYKVIRIVIPLAPQAPPLVEVYSANTDSWRKLQSLKLPRGADRLYCNATLKGVQYWDFHYDEREVTTFDLHKEVVGRISFPNITEPDETHVKKIMEFKDSVAIVVYPWDPIFSEIKGLSVWVLDDEDFGGQKSWTKKFNFETFSSNLRPYKFLKNGEMLSKTSGEQVFHLHDLTTEEETTEKFRLPDSTFRIADFNYVESLVSFEGSKRVWSMANKGANQQRKKRLIITDDQHPPFSGARINSSFLSIKM